MAQPNQGKRPVGTAPALGPSPPIPKSRPGEVRSGSLPPTRLPSQPSPQEAFFQNTYTPGMTSNSPHPLASSLPGSGVRPSPRSISSIRSPRPEDVQELIAAQLTATSQQTVEEKVKETMVLKVVILEARMSDKEKKDKETKSKPVLPGPKGYFCTAEVVNSKGQPCGGDFNQRTKNLDDKYPSWNQSFLFTIPRSSLGDLHHGLLITIGKMDEKKQVSKQLGVCPIIQLTDLPETGLNDRILRFNANHPLRSLKVRLGWYGTGARAKKAKEDLIFSSILHFTEEDVKTRAQQVIDLGQSIEEAQQELAQAKELSRPYETVLSRYVDIDDSIQEVLGSNQPLSSPTVAHETYRAFQEDPSPVKCSEFILVNQTLDHIPEIKRVVSSEDTKWRKNFLLRDGLENIVKVLYTVETSKFNPALHVKEAQLASIIKVLVNDSTLCEEIISNFSEPLQRVVGLFITTKNKLMKAQMLALLSGLCMYSQEAHHLIYGSVVALDESQPLLPLVQIVKNEKDREIITSAMMLVNCLIAGERELGARMKIRKRFFQTDLLTVMHKLRERLPEEKPLILQIESFKFMSETDEDEFKILGKIGNLDLFDQNSVYSQLSAQVSALDERAAFLRHLQHLILIPNVTEQAKDAWLFIERSSRRATTTTEKEANGELTLVELNRQYRTVLSDKISQLTQWNKNRPPPPPLPPSARKKHGIKDDVVAALPNAPPSMESRDGEPELDPSVPEPQKQMKGFHWTGKHENNVENKEYWDQALIPMEDLDFMFQDLQDRFYQPKSSVKKKEKVSFLSVPVANAISIWRAQFPHLDSEAIINDIFDIENSAGSIFTYHFEALISALPSEAEAEQLLAYTGNPKDLEPADQFALCLLRVPRLFQKLQNLIFWDEFELRKTCLEDMLSKIIEACEVILNHPKLLKVTQMVLSVSNYLFTPGKTIQDDQSKQPSKAMMSYLSGFITKNFQDLIAFKDLLFFYEDAMRHQPTILFGEVTDFDNGLQNIRIDLEFESEDDPKFASYYTAMIQFKEYAEFESNRILGIFDLFTQQANEVLVSFGKPTSENPIQDLWGQFYVFCSQFKQHVESIKEKEEEAERRSKLTARQNRIQNREEGSIDDLINSIRQGFLTKGIW